MKSSSKVLLAAGIFVGAVVFLRSGKSDAERDLESRAALWKTMQEIDRGMGPAPRYSWEAKDRHGTEFIVNSHDGRTLFGHIWDAEEGRSVPFTGSWIGNGLVEIDVDTFGTTEARVIRQLEKGPWPPPIVTQPGSPVGTR